MQLALSFSPSLQMLHLVDCGKLSFGSIQHIVKNCVNLTEMNLTLTYLSENSVKFLASNLTPKIEKLSLGQLESVKGWLISKGILILVRSSIRLNKQFFTNLAI